jgi:hypothetical protein
MLIQFHSDNNRTLLGLMRISAVRIELSVPVTVRSGSDGRGGRRRSRSPELSAFCGARPFLVGTLGRGPGEGSFPLDCSLRGPGPQAPTINPRMDFPRRGTCRAYASRNGSEPSPPASDGYSTRIAVRSVSWRTCDWAGRRIDALGALLARVRVPSWRAELQSVHRELVGTQCGWGGGSSSKRADRKRPASLDQFLGSGSLNSPSPPEADRGAVFGPPVSTGEDKSGIAQDRMLTPPLGWRSTAVEPLVGQRRAPSAVAVWRSRMLT